MVTYLEAAMGSPLEGDAIRLRVPAGYFYDYLSAAANLTALKDLAQTFFSRAMNVAVEAQAQQPRSDEPAVPDPTPAELHQAALDDPSVKAAVEILGGEVQEVRARRKARKESA
jgi:hypothetical protein